MASNRPSSSLSSLHLPSSSSSSSPSSSFSSSSRLPSAIRPRPRRQQGYGKVILFTVSLALNTVLLIIIFIASFSLTTIPTKTFNSAMTNSLVTSNTKNAGGNNEELVCKLEEPGIFLDAPVSASPLSRGLTLGPYWYNLSDIIAFVPVESLNQAYPTFYGWGDILQAYGSYEVYMMKGYGALNAPPEVLNTGLNIPLPIPTKKYKVKSRKQVTLYIREIIFPGQEKKNSRNSAKTEKLLRWVSTQIDACAEGVESPYCSRKWFVKANPDVFIIPKHLLALLSHYNASKPICVSNMYSCDGTKACPKTSVYALSAPAIVELGKVWKEEVKVRVSQWDSKEGIRMEALLEKAGVQMVDVGDAFFNKRMGERSLTSRNPLVTLGGADGDMMRDYRALVNIEFKHSYFD